MKYLYFFLLLCALGINSQAQTGAVVDHDKYVQITFQDGEKIAVGKNLVESLRIYLDKVYIITTREVQGSVRLSRKIALNPADFGFASVDELFTFMNRLMFSVYTIQYHYTNGLLDTVSYFAGDSLAFRTAYSYSGSVISQKSEPINQ